MSTRTAVPGTKSTSQTLSAANYNDLPGGWIGYVEVTSSQTSIASAAVTDLTSLTVTVTVNTSRRIKVTGKVQITKNTNTGVVHAYIRESTTTLQTFMRDSLASGESRVAQGSVILTPSAGSHTYKLSVDTSTDTIDSSASATAPAFILVEDLGPQ